MLINSKPLTAGCRALPALVLCMLPVMAPAALLDEATTDGFLRQMADTLEDYGIDVLPNLNHRQWAGARNFRPRLGRFPDLPDSRMPDSEEIATWEQEYGAGTVGGLAVLATARTGPASPAMGLWEKWVTTYSADRIFISFAQADRDLAAVIAKAAAAAGYRTRLFAGKDDATGAARFYTTAARRLALDSQAARRLDSRVTELSYLGQRVRRNSNSLFRDSRPDRRLARHEPAVFLKESLGDEFSESTVREIVVPGGVALGESAHLQQPVHALRFAGGRLALLGTDGTLWQLPAIEVRTLKALFDFALRSERIQSDAIVDIDARGRVRISAALRDTDVGWQIMHADTLPFEYVNNLRVSKSVIVDTGVEWFAVGPDRLDFSAGFEVRFLSADNLRLAQTRVALQYRFDSVGAVITYLDHWGPDTRRLRKDLAYDELGNVLGKVAEAAGWIALWRKTLDDRLGFLDGRYEFMKIDKSGTVTPDNYWQARI